MVCVDAGVKYCVFSIVLGVYVGRSWEQMRTEEDRACAMRDFDVDSYAITLQDIRNVGNCNELKALASCI